MKFFNDFTFPVELTCGHEVCANCIIKELHQEKTDIKKQQRELKKLHVSFNKSKKEKEQRVAELSEKTRDVQMLKFGQIVDLEKLEKLGATKIADDIKEKLQKEELQRIKELSGIEVKYC